MWTMLVYSVLHSFNSYQPKQAIKKAKRTGLMFELTPRVSLDLPDLLLEKYDRSCIQLFIKLQLTVHIAYLSHIETPTNSNVRLQGCFLKLQKIAIDYNRSSTFKGDFWCELTRKSLSLLSLRLLSSPPPPPSLLPLTPSPLLPLPSHPPTLFPL